MPRIAKRVKKFLDEDGVRYDVVPHERDYTAQETAHHTHTPAHAFAKAVVARAGELHEDAPAESPLFSKCVSSQSPEVASCRRM